MMNFVMCHKKTETDLKTIWDTNFEFGGLKCPIGLVMLWGGFTKLCFFYMRNLEHLLIVNYCDNIICSSCPLCLRMLR